MEEKSFAWLLSALSDKKIPVKILETGICRGSKLLSWYSTDPLGVIHKNKSKEISHTRHLLSFFLNQRVPLFESSSPDKVICYLYHRKGVKIVTAVEAVQLVHNQLHGLQVRSIHMAPSSAMNYYYTYCMEAWNNNGELESFLSYGKFPNEIKDEVKDPVICERALSLTLYLNEIIFKVCSKYINNIKIDLISDGVGQLFIIKIKELSISSEFVKSESLVRRNARNATFKIEADNADYMETFTQFKLLHEREQKKKEANFKLPPKKSVQQNSTAFLEMIAKTIDRERKVQEHIEAIKTRRKVLESEENDDKKRILRVKSLRSARESIDRSPAFNSINDVLGYIEKTRPLVWVKDNAVSESQTPNYMLATPVNEKRGFPDSLISESGKTKTSSKLQGSTSLNSFRRANQQNFNSFLSDEEARIKQKLTKNRFKLPNHSKNTDRISGYKPTGFGLDLKLKFKKKSP